MHIHTAYAHGKHGYRAVAYVAESIGGNVIKHTHRLGLGDSAREAISDAVAYIQDTYAREGLEYSPNGVTEHGRIAGALLDSRRF